MGAAMTEAERSVSTQRGKLQEGVLERCASGAAALQNCKYSRALDP